MIFRSDKISLMETAQFLQIVAENTSDVIAVYSLDWKYLNISASCKSVFGYDPDELIGHPVYENIHPDDLARILNDSSELITTFKSQTLSYRFKRKEGNYIWIDTIVRKIEGDGKGIIIAVTRDITTRKSSEEMVKKFVEAVEYASDAIIMAEPDGKIMYANPAIENITEFTPEEVVGKHANSFWAKQDDPHEVANMWETLKTKKKYYTSEVINNTKTGRIYFTQTHISPIFGPNKQITFFVGISRDVTRAREIDKMKNEFISLASHQLRTPLTAIKWRLETLMDKANESLPATVKGYIRDINTSNERMIELVNSLLNISRIESGKLIVDPKMTSLEELMLSVLDDVENNIKTKKIKLTLSFQTNIFDINIDPKLIRNAYLNVLSNAVKYTPENGAIEIAIYLDGENIVTKIKDSGYGIPRNDQPRVFEKFFRGSNVTNIETEGTGLGLYLVKKIVEESNGKVWFESDEGKGTTFWIALKSSGTLARKGEVSLTD